MKKEVKLPRPSEVWQGFGKTLYMCIEINFNHSRELALVGLSGDQVLKKPWLAELTLNEQQWKFYLKHGKMIKVADSWFDYQAMSSIHSDQEVRSLFSILANDSITREY